ncbi:hypothetical protein KQI84_00185 [bacterium]|nr:hypothetical protein [bacterium]
MLKLATFGILLLLACGILIIWISIIAKSERRKREMEELGTAVMSVAVFAFSVLSVVLLMLILSSEVYGFTARLLLGICCVLPIGWLGFRVMKDLIKHICTRNRRQGRTKPSA